MKDKLEQGKSPGEWMRTIVDEFSDATRWGAIITCPECKRRLLVRDHTIAPDGQISPSVGHPAEYPFCSWHTHPQLIGWSPVPPLPIHAIHICTVCRRETRQLGGWGIMQGKLTCQQCLETKEAQP